jgi:hypothetical protein
LLLQIVPNPWWSHSKQSPKPKPEAAPEMHTAPLFGGIYVFPILRQKHSEGALMISVCILLDAIELEYER